MQKVLNRKKSKKSWEDLFHFYVKSRYVANYTDYPN